MVAGEIVVVIEVFFKVVVAEGNVVVWVAMIGCEIMSPGTVVCIGVLVVTEAVGSDFMIVTGLFWISLSRGSFGAMLFVSAVGLSNFPKACLGCQLSSNPSPKTCCVGTIL